jgi:hypothetical protein
VAGLHPGSFAFVMATGILSVGLRNHGLAGPSAALLAIAAAGYVLLVGLTLARAVAFAAALRAEFTDPRRGFGFFTFVAATDVLGTRLVLCDHRSGALALLVVGWAAWVALGYTVPWTAVLGRARRPVVAAANGTWFIWVVASQSVAVLAAALQPTVSTGRRELALLAVFCWAVGALLYGAAGIMVAARLLLYPLRPADLSPPHWVAMGAAAISTLAGARIVQMADAPMVHVTGGLIAGASVVFWAFGSWLIPPAGGGRLVAARDPPHPAALRDDLVERRLPAGDVRRRRALPRCCRPPTHRPHHR